jgi:hypothetical protein
MLLLPKAGVHGASAKTITEFAPRMAGYLISTLTGHPRAPVTVKAIGFSIGNYPHPKLASESIRKLARGTSRRFKGNPFVSLPISAVLRKLAGIFAGCFLVLGLLSCTLFNPGARSAERGTATAQALRAVSFATERATVLQKTSTAEALQAATTSQARQALLSRGAAWPSVLVETFASNENDWPTGEEDGDLTSISLSITNGLYKWEALAHESFIYWSRPEMPIVTDFNLSLEAQQITGPADGQMGVVFRQVDADNYYLFRISQDQYYALQRSAANDWIRIIDWTPCPYVNPEEVNKISVMATGSNYFFFVNGQFITEVFDDNLSSGRVGVAIGLSNPGDQAVFQFDNFALNAPFTSTEIP